MNKQFKLLAVIAAILLAGSFAETAAQTKLTWLGHAAFSITTPKGKVLLIDPWLRSPANPDVKAGDYIMQPGGEIQIADGEVTIAMTEAVHSSSVFNPKAGPNEPERAYGGSPAGFVIMIRNGPTIYHTGDTAYFKDMEIIGETYSIDVALINISQMGAKMSARAAQSVRAKLAVPMHFGTFPGLLQTADEFAVNLKQLKIPFYEMKPGETVTFRGRQMVRSR